jgi:hypothetical protein
MNKIIGVFSVLGFALSSCTFQTQDSKSFSESSEGEDMPRIDGWSSSRVLLTVNDTNILQADFPEAGSYTLQFNVDTAGIGKLIPDSHTLRIWAEITWFVQGNTVQRQISPVNGVSISGNGQGVKAIIRMGDNASAPVNTQILCSAGVRPGGITPPTYQPADNFQIGGHTSAQSDIPLNIGAVSLWFTAYDLVTLREALPADYSVEQWNSVLVGSPNLAQCYPKLWQPLMSGADQLNVRNISANPIVFSFTYGIDG